MLHVSESGVHRESVAPKVKKQGTEAHREQDMITTVTETFLALYRAQVSRGNSHKSTRSLILEDPGSRDNFILHAFSEELKIAK